MADDLSNLDQPADFRRQGRDLALGADDAGVAKKNAALYERAAINIAGSIFSTIKESIGDILDFAGLALEQFEDKAALIFTPLMARLVGHALGVDVSSEAIRERMDRSGDGAIGKVVAQTVFEILQPPGGVLQPGDASARRAIGAIGHMTINNWAEGLTLEWLAEYLGWDIHLEALPHLATELIGNLGLNELASRALRPYANIVIRTPLTWQLNKQYRPKMLDVGAAAGAMFRGDIDESTFLEIAQREGYGDEAIAAIVSGHRKNLTPADAYLLFQLGLKDRDFAIEQMRAGGLDPAEAELAFTLQEAKSLRTYQLEAAQSAVTAYGQHIIDGAALADEIDQLGLDDTTLQRFHAEAERRRRLHVLHLSRADVEFAVENGVLSVSDYHDWLDERGYATNDALTLELNLQAKLRKIEDARAARSQAAAAREAAKAAKLQAQQAKRDTVASEHAHWTGTLGQAERLVVRGVLAPSLYRQILVDHAVAAGDADELLAVAVQDRDVRAAQLAKRATAAAAGKAPALSLGALVHAILVGARSINDLAPAMAAAGYSSADVSLEVDSVTHELATRAAAAAAKAAKTPAGSAAAVTLAQLERAVLDGATSIDRYRAALVAAGYSPLDQATLETDLSSRLAARQFADARHALAEEKFVASQLTLSQEEKAVVDGILTLADYQQFLEAHGFDENDVAILTALLQTKLPAA